MRQEIGQYADPLKSANERVSEKFMQRQLNAIAVNAFALFGLLLAAMGIYGSVAYAAKQRTQEIGIRVALGATRSDVVTTLSRRGLQIAVLGVVVGTFGAFALTRVLQSMVIATAAASVPLLVAVGLVMISTVVVATLVPAFQATRTDPVSALRGE
jgi:ABC-type antimicrobial peptide transport system permease subunit